MITVRRYWSSAVMAATVPLSDRRPLFLIRYAQEALSLIILLVIWRTVLGPTEEAGGLTLAQILTYTLVARAFGALLHPTTNLESTLWDGSVVTRFSRPMSVFGGLAAEMAGRWSTGIVLFTIPVMAAAPLLGVDPRPASLGHGLLFVGSLAAAIAVGLAIDLLFASAMVWLEQSLWAVAFLRGAVTSLLSGGVIPLAVFPFGIGAVLELLPFAQTASAPLRIYVGDGDALLLLRQAAWAVVLWPVALELWKRNRQRLVGHGG